MKRIHIVPFILAASLTAAGMVYAASEAAVPEVPEASDQQAAEVMQESSYISEHLPGASAVYVSGETLTFDDTEFYSAGYATDEDITAQIPNQYGMCAVVLAAGQGTDVTLNNPTITSDPESYSNGVFAAAMAKVTINGGTIDTDNSSGHGIDTTYMGHVYVKDTAIHTRGETSGALASDFGGGFISAENLDIQTEGGSSPGIFCAGSTIIILKDSTINTTKATGVVVAHDHSVVVLDNCEVDAAGNALNGLQALPSPESSEGSRCFVFGGSLTSQTGAVIAEGGGRTEVNLIGPSCTPGSEESISVTRGIMTVNLWNTELTGNIHCEEGNSLTVNLYDGAVLTGDVTGEGEVVINVYDGGTYNGSFAVNEAGEGAEAPTPGAFDDYLMSDWAAGALKWQGSTTQTYVDSVEPRILENSAACFAANKTTAVEYDPEVYDPSENGVDLSVLAEKSAHGFTYDEVFGGAESRGGAGTGESADGESSGESPDGQSDGGSPGGAANGESPEGESTGESPEGATNGESPEGESEGETADNTAKN